jgi:murein peptide amidase A
VQGAAFNQLLARLKRMARESTRIETSSLGGIESEGTRFELPRSLFIGPSGGGDPIRIGVFAGIHGDEPAGIEAVAKFLEELEKDPDLAQGYELYCYPVCNPTGLVQQTRYSAGGKDLNREFWKHSAEPEVVLLEREIQTRRFDGLISLHADDTSNGMYGFVRGAVLTRALLEPALAAAEMVLPRNTENLIDGFAAVNGIISECYDGILTSPPALDPLPFEIILETPHAALQEKQVAAFVVALQTILGEYRKLLAFAPNL